MTVDQHTTVQTETSRYAIVAIVWAVLGLTVPIPFLFPILALSFAKTARQHVAGSGGRLKGVELAEAARQIAWFELVIWAVAALVAVLVVYIATST